MKDKSSAELFKIVRDQAYKLWDVEGGPVVRAALAELEGRWATTYETQQRMAGFGTPRIPEANLHERLKRVEADLAAFRREHAGHTHRFDYAGMRTPVRTLEPALDGAIADMRDNAENRAWSAIGEWISKAGPYACAVEPPNDRHPNTWDAHLMHGTLDDRAASKSGTSRLDALAHLAAWCTEDMHGPDEAPDYKRTIKDGRPVPRYHVVNGVPCAGCPECKE